MQHYVCPACGGTSDHEKNCETEGCHLHNQPLSACTCEDGQHAEAMAHQAPDHEAHEG